MDEEQGLVSPIAGGIRGIRRSVSSSVFTGRAVPPPVRGDNISNNLISQNSLALSNVSMQLGGIADQVRSVNSSLAIIKDNLAISDELEKKKEFEKRKREAQLAEQGLREGKESELEKKIQFALLAPVRRVSQVARGILSRLGESLLYLAGGWLTSQALKFLQLNSEGNVEALKKFKDRFLKDLLIIGGIFLAATVGLGKVFALVKGLGALLTRVTFSGFLLNSFKGLGAFILSNVGKFINFIKSGVGRILGFGLGRGFNPNLLIPGVAFFEKRIRKFLEKTPLIGRFFKQKVPITTSQGAIQSTRTGVFGKIFGNSLILLFETLNAFSQKQLLIAAGLEPFQAFITSFARAFGQFALFTGFVKATSLAVGGVFAGLGALLGLAGGPFAPLTVGVGAAKGFAVGKAVGGVLGTLAFFFPEKTKQLTGGLVDIQKFKENTDKVSTEIGMGITGVDKETKDKVRSSSFFGKIDGNFSEEDDSQNISGEKSEITGAEISGAVVPFKTNKNGDNLELSDSTANIIDATSASNFKPGRFGFSSGNDSNSNEVPTINSSNENDYQPILVDYYTNINNP